MVFWMIGFVGIAISVACTLQPKENRIPFAIIWTGITICTTLMIIVKVTNG